MHLRGLVELWCRGRGAGFYVFGGFDFIAEFVFEAGFDGEGVAAFSIGDGVGGGERVATARIYFAAIDIYFQRVDAVGRVAIGGYGE